MGMWRAISLSTLLMFSLYVNSIDGATFNIKKNCPYTVWAAAVPGGSKWLDRGQSWDLNVPAGMKQARIWARTKYQFDASGKGKCQMGDYGGLLQCKAFGQPPNTLADPTCNGCTRGIKCTANINGQCPSQLSAPGGCNNPCTVLKTDQYCCNSGRCAATDFSRFFKSQCPDAYSYLKDD
ncbi:hypothetical protein CRG98_030577 [Punica granatum]|uniref:Uncharacterized protein n=1 Tax=Punica granatum TaxID=22663 RepID=A0A2I0IZ92_PUNGR|nr:hypothetical protein CRG98_030577 [Punica granatum]